MPASSVSTPVKPKLWPAPAAGSKGRGLSLEGPCQGPSWSPRQTSWSLHQKGEWLPMPHTQEAVAVGLWTWAACKTPEFLPCWPGGVWERRNWDTDCKWPGTRTSCCRGWREVMSCVWAEAQCHVVYKLAPLAVLASTSPSLWSSRLHSWWPVTLPPLLCVPRLWHAVATPWMLVLVQFLAS
jgi:hypothetical protein